MTGDVTALDRPRCTRNALWLAGIVLLGAALRFADLGRLCLTGDDAWSINAAIQPFIETMRIAESDVHPPLHTIMLWCWVRLAGTSEAAVRIPAVIAGITLIPLVYLIVRDLAGDRRIAMASAYLVAISPHLVLFSRSARWYMPFAALALLATWCWVSTLVRGRTRATTTGLMLACIAGALYNLTFTGIMLAQWVIYALTPVGRRGRSWTVLLGAHALSALVVAPWMVIKIPGLIRGSAGFDRAPIEGGIFGKVAYLLYSFDVGATLFPWRWHTVVPYALATAIALAWALLTLRRKPAPTPGPVIGPNPYAVLPVLAAVPVAMFIWLPRMAVACYYLASNAAYLALKALILMGSSNRVPAAMGLLAATVIAALGQANMLAGRDYLGTQALDDWRGVARRIDDAYRPGDLVITGHPAMLWYLKQQGTPALNAYAVKQRDVETARRIIWERSPGSGASERKGAGPSSLDRMVEEEGFAPVVTLNLNPDPDAAMKRRFVRRPFPPYRTFVDILEREEPGTRE